MVDGSTCPFIGSGCSLVWERRTTCWVTMRVPHPNILLVWRPPPFCERRDLDHHVPACSERARACWGGGCQVCLWSRPISVGGGGRGSKRSAPLFPGPQGEPAHGLHPRFVVAEIWADGDRGGGGGGRHLVTLPQGCWGDRRAFWGDRSWVWGVHDSGTDMWSQIVEPSLEQAKPHYVSAPLLLEARPDLHSCPSFPGPHA